MQIGTGQGMYNKRRNEKAQNKNKKKHKKEKKCQIIVLHIRAFKSELCNLHCGQGHPSVGQYNIGACVQEIQRYVQNRGAGCGLVTILLSLCLIRRLAVISSLPYFTPEESKLRYKKF